MGLRISEGVNADYAETIPKGQSQELIRRSRRTRETKKDGLVLFKIENREILACTLILLHLTKSSCESTVHSHIFPDCFGLKNGLSLATRPYAFIFYFFGGTKRATPLFCWTLPLLVFDDFPNLTLHFQPWPQNFLLFFWLLKMLLITGAIEMNRKGNIA